MSERITRVSLAAAGKGRTDWDRLASLDDIEITARALDDPDTIIATPADLAAFSQSHGKVSPRFEVRRVKSGGYRWRLLASEGTELAVGPEDYASREAALTAVKSLLFALGNIDGVAA